eukprot:3155741-Rhodomonas_salina.1
MSSHSSSPHARVCPRNHTCAASAVREDATRWRAKECDGVDASQSQRVGSMGSHVECETVETRGTSAALVEGMKVESRRLRWGRRAMR